MAYTRIKICGITRVQDAEAAASAGVDAIGLVFHPGSPRAVDIDGARRIAAALPPFVTTVGLFLDRAYSEVQAVLERVPLGLLQFHGQESAEFCRSFERPYIKAVGMADGADLAECARTWPDAAGLLADSHRPGEAGGTGQSFSWQGLQGEREYRLILAGGLGPENVGAAVREVRPDAVDVSTGVEESPGRKDAARIQRFIEEVRRGDRNET